MNVDTQFSQAPVAALPARPVDSRPEQAAVRPVDKSGRDEAANNQTNPETRETETQKASRQPENESRSGRQETELSSEDKQQLEQLRSRDREVRAHEAAHKAAAGGLARGGASFEFENGPDGRRYAVGGEVSIDTSKVSGDPQATINKAQTIRAAANAPAQPSGQDRSVAAQASTMETEARQELAETQRAESAENTASAGSATNVGSAESSERSNASDEPGRTPAAQFQANSSNAEPVGELLDVVA